MKTKPTDEQLVAEYLRRHKRITPLHAMWEYRISDLASVIRRLRSTHRGYMPAGVEIKTIIRADDNGRNYAKYTVKQVGGQW